MQAVIVYESMYGNTRQIAEAIAEGVHEAAPDAQVSCLPVAGATADVTRSADLLVVGGPTHMHGMTSGLSRDLARGTRAQNAARESGALAAGAEPDDSPGLRTWFHHLPDTENGTHAAAFDTRVDFRLSGGAADGIARRLARHHYDVLAEPEGFIVEDAEGPLRAGELDRARTWGAGLV
ncbi:flavodoxin family protein [Kitasatospora sp. DSM 101779]|uniref:flavodoxin family protein n=1 Tax=Kitasatospora sp. DSM 101779 TaxID=2853165 RepID=UPI0021D7F3E1|nr:flavodoxin domain-containing protein [Kitasatospora sp. DSM 101779]MCU7826442.1 flavodoxin domain-containing protein [Kitasatospora sp. DSM 101779]